MEELSTAGNDKVESVASLPSGGSQEVRETVNPSTGTGLSEKTDMPPPDQNLSVDECILQGGKALDRYDYDACETYFRSAVKMSGGSVEAAVLLLELYVDHLGAYEKALAVREDFSSGTLKDERARLLMGLASVHCGHFEQAMDYVDRISDPRVADIYLAAARYYIQGGTETLALKALSRLKSRADASREAEVLELDQQFRLLKADRTTPLKKDMARAFEANLFPDALALAERILKVLPDDPEARKIYHKVLKRQRLERISRLLGEADGARGRHDFEREVSLLAEAITLGAGRRELSERLQTARNKAVKQREEMEISEFQRLLANEGLAAALSEFVNLNEKKRKRLAGNLADVHFRWLREILSADENAGRGKGVGAVMALSRAKRDLEAGKNPKNILEMLRSHAGVLQWVPEARALMQRAESLVQADNFSENKALLRQAARYLEKNHRDLGKAEQALSAVKTGYLDDTNRQELQVLKSRHRSLESLHMLKQQYSSAERRGDHFTCMDLAEKLMGRDDDGVSKVWAGKRLGHVTAVKRAWALQNRHIRDLPKTYGCLGVEGHWGSRSFLLLPDGRHVVIATSHDRWMFIRIFSIDDQCFTEGIVFRTSKALDIPRLYSEGDMLWVVGEYGRAVALCLNPLLIRHDYDFSGFAAKSEVIEETLVFPAEKILWLRKHKIQDHNESVDVIRWDRGRTIRTFTRSNQLIPVNCGDGFEVAVTDFFQGNVRILTLNGRPLQTIKFEETWLTDGVVSHPNGIDYVCLGHRDPDSDGLPDDMLREGEAFHVTPLTLQAKPDISGNISPWVIEGSDGELDPEMTPLKGADIIFVNFEGDGGDRRELTALKPTDRGFDELYRVPVPNNFVLVSNERSDALAGLVVSRTEIHAVRLDHQPPCLEHEHKREEMPPYFPSFSSIWSCDEETGDFKKEILAAMLPSTENRLLLYRQQVRKIKQENDPDRAAVLVRVFKYSSLTNDEKSLREWMKQHHPNHCRVLMDAAKRAARKQDWPQVVSLLERVAPRDLDGGSARHRCHLLGMAYFATGDAAKALSTWKQGKRYKDGRCELDPYIAYANLSLKNEDQRKRARLREDMKRGLALFETVDPLIGAGQWRKALSAMESKGVLQIKNVQLQARFAWVYLNQDLNPSDNRFMCKILVLAGFCERYGKDFFRGNPILPYHLETWPESRLKEIARKSKDWLDNLGG